MKKCPHCGGELADDTIYCKHCNRSLIRHPGNPMEQGPHPLITALMALVLLLLVFLIGFGFYQRNPTAAAIFLMGATLFLAFLATWGRYQFPGLRQYLLTFLIALIPLIGAMYVTVFAARYAATKRAWRIALTLSLLAVLAVSTLLFGNLEELQNRFAGMQWTPTPTSPIRTRTPTPAGTDASRPQASPSALATSEPTATQALEAVVEGCVFWSDVSLEMVGEKTCVYGEYLEIFQKNDQGWVLAFSQEPGTFQVWSAPNRPMESLLPAGGGACVVARGWVQTSGVRPIVILGTQGVLEGCE